MRLISLSLVCIFLAVTLSAHAREVYDPVTDRWKLEGVAEAHFSPLNGGRPLNTPGWTFGPEVRVNDPTSGFHLWPDVAAGGPDTVHALWMDERTGRYRIYYSYSANLGLTWSSDELVDDSPTGMCRFPAIAVDQAGGTYAAWEDSRAGDFDVYFSRRVASGTTFIWTPSEKVNDAGSSPGGADYMSACISAGAPGHVYLAWTDWREGVYHQVYFSASTDSGANWTPDTRISDEVGVDPLAGDPSLRVDPDDSLTVYCVFNDWRDPHGPRYPEVYFSESTDGGATWGANVRVNDISAYYQQVASRVIGVDDYDLIYVMWFNSDFVGMPEARVSVSEDGGLTFGSSARVNDEPTSEVGTYPSLAVDSTGRAFGVWMDYRDGHWNVYFSTSSDTGRSWLPNVRVDTSETNTSDYNPVVTVDRQRRVGVAWSYYPHGEDYQIVFCPGVEETVGVTSPPMLPDPSVDFHLGVAPNPFRQLTIINYQLPMPGHTTLRVYDAAGRVIATLMDGTLPAGSHQVTWETNDTPSGIYFFVLDAGGQTVSRKVVLVK